MDRKRRESGVRAVLKGKHVVTAEDVYEQAPNTEEATREKRARKPRKVRERSSSPSSEEDIDPVDDFQPSHSDIGDCIVVEF